MGRTKPYCYVSASDGKEERVYVTLKIWRVSEFIQGYPTEGPWGHAALTPGQARQLSRYLTRSARASIRNYERAEEKERMPRGYSTFQLLLYSLLSWGLVLMVFLMRPDPYLVAESLYFGLIAAGFAWGLIMLLIVAGRFVKETLEMEGKA